MPRPARGMAGPVRRCRPRVATYYACPTNAASRTVVRAWIGPAGTTPTILYFALASSAYCTASSRVGNARTRRPFYYRRTRRTRKPLSSWVFSDFMVARRWVDGDESLPAGYGDRVGFVWTR